MAIVIDLNEYREAKKPPVADEGESEGFYFLEDETCGYDEEDYYYDDDEPGMSP